MDGGEGGGRGEPLLFYRNTVVQKYKKSRYTEIKKYKNSREKTQRITKKGEREKYENAEKVRVVVGAKWGELFCSSSLRSKRLSTAQ